MPCYFFDLQHDADPVGMMLPDLPAAQQTAVRYAGEILRDMAIDSRNRFYWRMDVRQDSGPTLFSLVLDLVPVPATATRRRAEYSANDRREGGVSMDWQSI